MENGNKRTHTNVKQKKAMDNTNEKNNNNNKNNKKIKIR